MAFTRIQDLLERFRNLQPTDKYIKDACIAAIEELFSTTITADELDVHNDTIYLRVHPALKSEIHIKKQRTIDLINTKLEKKAVSNLV